MARKRVIKSTATPFEAPKLTKGMSNLKGYYESPERDLNIAYPFFAEHVDYGLCFVTADDTFYSFQAEEHFTYDADEVERMKRIDGTIRFEQ